MSGRRVSIVAAALLALLVTATSASPRSAAPPVQTSWLILSATGTTDYIANASLTGEPGPGDDWSFDANFRVTWRQTARNAGLPGSRVVSFNFKTMPSYVPSQAGQQQNPIRDVVATRFAIPRSQCPKLRIPLGGDAKREQIKRTGLAKLYPTKPCAKTSLTIFRTFPVVERDGTVVKTVGRVTERAKLTLQVPKYVNGRPARCK